MCCIECEQTEVCRNRSRLGIDLDSYMYFLDCEGSPFEKMRMGGCRSPGYEAVTPMETALTLSADRDTPLTPAPPVSSNHVVALAKFAMCFGACGEPSCRPLSRSFLVVLLGVLAALRPFRALPGGPLRHEAGTCALQAAP